jgi:hypothetical protein
MAEIDLDDIVKEPLDSIVRGPMPLANLPANLPDMTVMSPEEVTDDQICISIKEDDIADNVLKAIVYGMAEEQASLKTLRTKRQKEGKDTSGVSLKRGMLLKYMSETMIQKQALMGVAGDIDLHSPKFREVFKMFLETISDTFDEVKIPSEFKEMFFHALSKNLEGWENRAESAIRMMKAE